MKIASIFVLRLGPLQHGDSNFIIYIIVLLHVLYLKCVKIGQVVLEKLKMFKT